MTHTCLSLAAIEASGILAMTERAVAENATDLNKYASQLYARKHEAFDIEDRTRNLSGRKPGIGVAVCLRAGAYIGSRCFALRLRFGSLTESSSD